MSELKFEVQMGHPAMFENAALVVPSNEYLHLRGELGRKIEAVAGPLLQIEALRQAPKTLGDVVPVNGHGAAVKRVYFAACYPHDESQHDEKTVIQTLVHAIRKACEEGYQKVVVPFFVDKRAYDPTVLKDEMVRILAHAHHLIEDLKDVKVILATESEKEKEIFEEALDFIRKLGHDDASSKEDAESTDTSEESEKTKATGARRGRKPSSGGGDHES